MNPKSLAALKAEAGEPAPKPSPKVEAAPLPTMAAPNTELLAALRELVIEAKTKPAVSAMNPVRKWKFIIHRDDDGFQDYVIAEAIE